MLALLATLPLAACDRKSPDAKSASSTAAESLPPPDPAMVAAGEKIFAARQCVSCHTTDGSPGMGPTLAGIFGKHQKLVDGREVIVDIPYLRRSLIDPQADIVPGFPAQMLSYKDVLAEKEIAALIAYIRTLKPEEEEAAPTGAH
jgi:mono/diheme cytochrome c family protein